MHNILNHISKRKWQTSLLGVWVFLVIISLSVLTPLSKYSEVLSAGYTWTQTDWSGGVTANDAVHPGDQSGWDEYASSTGPIDTSGGSLKLVTPIPGINSTTHTNDTDFNSGAGTTTVIEGSGSGAYIRLATSSLTSLSVTGFTSSVNFPFGIYKQGNYIYSSAKGLDIIDITDITNPVVVGRWGTNNYSRQIDVVGNYAYVPIQSKGLYIIDISSSTNPVQVGHYVSTDGAYDVQVEGNLAYFADGGMFRIIDISSSTNPVQVGSANNPGTGRGVHVVGNYAYLGAEYSMLQIIDISSSTNPVIVGSGDTHDRARGLYIYDNYAYVGSVMADLQIFDISNPSNPSNVGNHYVSSFVEDVHVTENNIYAVGTGSGQSKLWVLDRSNPTNPSNIGNITIGSSVRNIYVEDYYAYIAENTGVYIVQVIGYDSGTWESSTIDTNATSSFTSITWNASTSASTTVKFQIASNNDNATWDYIGPDGTSGSYYTTSGSEIHVSHNGDRYIRYKAYLSSTNPNQTPELQDVTINYKGYGEIISSAYNTNDWANVLANISWNENLMTNTDIRIQIRTAPDSGGSPGNWSSWYGPTGTGDYFSTPTGGDPIPSTLSDGVDDQWLQYKISLIGETTNTPTISDFSLSYVVNGPPEISNFINNPSGVVDQDEDGDINFKFNLLDADNTINENYFFYDMGITLADEGGVLSSLDTTNIIVNNSSNLPSSGTILLDKEIITYTSNSTSTATLGGLTRGEWPGTTSWTTAVTSHTNGATVYLLANTTTGEGSKTVSASSTTFSGTMTPTTDIPNIYVPNATIAIASNDGELGNMTGVATSNTFTLDTTPPTGDFVHNSLNNELTISVIDDSPTAMMISNNSNLSADGLNADSGTWISYGTDGNVDGYGDTPLAGGITKSWIGTGSTIEMAYLQFKDNKGNLSPVYQVDVPRIPDNIIFQDVSNVSTNEYKLFLSWSMAPEPSKGFQAYKVYRSTGGAFSLQETITNRLQNYLTEENLSTSTEYSYKVYSVDNDGNTSEFGPTVSDTPDGQGGSDLTSPTITNVQTTDLLPQGATITWTTDELANGTVGYSTDLSYGLERGVSSMATDHSVVLSELIPNTTYNFRARSSDPSSNISDWDAGYQFTTPPGAQISNVTVTETTSVSATISWITDIVSDSYVVYSTNANMTSSTEIGTTDLVTNHQVQITNLNAGQTYYYYVKSSDASSNTSINNNAANYYSFLTTIDNVGPVISSVSTAVISDTKAIVLWQTNENSSSQVFYGTDTNFTSSTTKDTTLSIQHSVAITGLTKNTTYYFKVSSSDAGNNNTQDDNSGSGYSFTTTDKPGVVVDETIIINPIDSTPPQTTTTDITSIGSTTATVHWTTGELGNSFVAYGISSSYNTIAGNYTDILSPTNNHIVNLSNLHPSTTYHYQTISYDSSGNIGKSSDLTFVTLNQDGSETSPSEIIETENNPQINMPGIESSGLSNEEDALLDTISKASESFITAILSVLPNNPNLDKIPEDAFVKTVEEIAPKVVSSPEITSQDLTVEVGSDWARFNWVTNKKSNAVVGIIKDEIFNGKYIRKEGDLETMTTKHTVLIEGLKPQTKYHYQLQSKGSLGDWAKSPDATFITTSLLSEIEELGFDNIFADNAVLSWKTSLPTRTTIEVTNTVTGEKLVYEDPSLLKEHTVNIDDLSFSTNYVLQVISSDEESNISSSSVIPFTTQASLVPPVIDNIRTTTALIPGQVSRVQTIVSWKTDKPSTSRILYEEGVSASTELAQATPMNLNLVRDHVVVTTVFKPGKVYRFRIESIDGAGHISYSKDYTILTPRQEENIVDLIIGNFEDSFGFLKNINF